MKAPRLRCASVADMPDEARKRLSECVLMMTYEEEEIALEGVQNLNLILGNHGLDLEHLADRIYGTSKNGRP